MNIIQALKDNYYKNRPMVSYWRHSDKVNAKLYRSEEGHYEMRLEGEKYPFKGRPRGSLLFGRLSKLKHELKNQVFNATWALLDEAKDPMPYLTKVAFPALLELAYSMRHDFIPESTFVPAVKEVDRAMKAVGVSDGWRQIITYILQEDDAYRFRFQWLAKFMPRIRKATWEDLDHGLSMMEHAEVVDDMKERVRLVRRVLNSIDSPALEAFVKEANWKKIALDEGDKYHFRAKYFRVDYPDYLY